MRANHTNLYTQTHTHLDWMCAVDEMVFVSTGDRIKWKWWKFIVELSVWSVLAIVSLYICRFPYYSISLCMCSCLRFATEKWQEKYFICLLMHLWYECCSMCTCLCECVVFERIAKSNRIKASRQICFSTKNPFYFGHIFFEHNSDPFLIR